QRTPVYAYLSRLSEDGPHLAFQQVPEPRAGKNRLHLDVRVDDREAFTDFVLGLGGSVVGEHQEGDFPAWTVLADPQGNEFCVYAR
ncbi:MAG: VOC family protein, partial [Acidimicrobiia bacterium]|nr:VOC family protein [Acidimicrobiia bacterium]